MYSIASFFSYLYSIYAKRNQNVMKTFEYQAKDLFASYGIRVERHYLCRTADEVAAAWDALAAPAVVVKAQVLSGGRGKAGGIKLAYSKGKAIIHAAAILRMKIKGLPVTSVLVSEAVSIKAEYYVSLAIDRNSRSVLLMLSASGGMDIEAVAAETPEKVHKFVIDPSIGIPDYLARRFALTLFHQTEPMNRLARIIQQLYKLFMEKDASLAEINPLVQTGSGELIAIDAKMTFDDNALYRHPDISVFREPTEDEMRELAAKDKGFSYVRMDGNIGCMVNGAGLAMATMDMIKLHGGEPANFLDIGGSSNPEKVVEAMKLLLSDRQVKVVLINIFGGITRCDDVATGLLKAFEQIQTDIPVIVRLTGTNEQKGRALLQGSRFLTANSMADATQQAIRTTNH